MNIVVIGAGEVGQHIAGVLSREEHAVTVIDADPTKVRKLTETLDVQALVGDGTRADVLTQSGCIDADLVVAVSDDDRVNMLASVVSKALGAKRIIVRLKDVSVLRGYQSFYKARLGFDVVMSTEALAAEEIMGLVRERHALEVETFADGKVQLRRLRLREASELTSAPLGQLRLPEGVLVAALSRGAELLVPSGDDLLQADDQLYIIGGGADLDAFERLAGERTLWKRTVVLMGAGGVGREIARRLRKAPGVTTLVLERDPARARALDAECSGDVMVLEGDATDIDLLQEERVSEANIFVATTDDDEKNMIACQLAKALGVERTVAMVNKASYRQLYDFLEGIDQAISPRILCANTILRFVRHGSPKAISVIGGGKGEVLQLQAGIERATRIKNLGLPRGAVIGAILRGADVVIPTGESTVQPDDQVIVFVMAGNQAEVARILRDPS